MMELAALRHLLMPMETEWKIMPTNARIHLLEQLLMQLDVKLLPLAMPMAMGLTMIQIIVPTHLLERPLMKMAVR